MTEETTATENVTTTAATTVAAEPAYGWLADEETMRTATESVPILEPMLAAGSRRAPI